MFRVSLRTNGNETPGSNLTRLKADHIVQKIEQLENFEKKLKKITRKYIDNFEKKLQLFFSKFSIFSSYFCQFFSKFPKQIHSSILRENGIESSA